MEGDFKEVLKNALENGFIPDTCGTDERYYTWGSNIDLCGMSVEDALEAADACCCGGGGGGSTKKNVITFTMTKGSNGEYYLTLNAKYAPTAPVNLSFTFDGVSQNVTMPAGQKTYLTDIQGENGNKYGTVENIQITTEDTEYTYTSSVSIANGNFTLTINKNGEITTETVKYGTLVELPVLPEREGYEAVWKDGDGHVLVDSFTMPEYDYTVNGTYEVLQYELSYTISQEVYDNENNQIVTEIYLSGSDMVDYDTPLLAYLNSKVSGNTGHTLSEFTIDGSVVTSNTKMPAHDVAAVATYTLNTYTLTYNSYNGQYSAETLYYGQAIIAPANPERIGYEFSAWNPQLPATMPANNLTVSAVFVHISYTLTYFVDDIVYATQQYYYEDTIVPPSNPSKTGYSFVAWDTLPATMPNDNLDVVASFTINSYTIQYSLSVPEGYSGETTHTNTYEYGAEVTPWVPEIESGYTKGEWSMEIPATMPANNLEITANVTANEYHIYYVVDGETAHTDTYAYREEINIWYPEEREGYEFSGWDPQLPATMPYDDLTPSGTFEIKQYTLTLTVEDEPYTSFTQDYGTQITVEDPAPREGYTFAWEEEIPETMPAEDVDINGLYTANNYTQTFFDMNAGVITAITQAYGTELVAPEAPEVIGYRFSGWTPEVPATVPAGDSSYTATYEHVVYTQYFYTRISGVEELFETITGYCGDVLTAPATPAVTGYTFSAWTPSVPATIPATDESYYADYVINSHVATYYTGYTSADTQYTSITYNYGDVISYPQMPVVSGYAFAWDEVYQTMPDGDIRINGVYTEQQDTVTALLGMVPSSSLTTYDFTTLSSIECDTEEYASGTTTVPAYPTYDEEGIDDLPDEEYEAWEEAHTYETILCFPQNTNFDLIDEGGDSVTELVEKLSGTFTYNGQTYEKWKYVHVIQRKASISFNYGIKIL